MKPSVFLLAGLGPGLVIALSASPAGAAAAAQTPNASQSTAQPADPVGEAYAQYLMAHRYEEDENADAAVAAYKRAIALDPRAADIVSDLANLYMRLNRATEAITAGEQALQIDPKNTAAHQVLGTIYASRTSASGRTQIPLDGQKENLTKAIDHIEKAFDGPIAQGDANLRAMLARLYLANSNYDKAIPVLRDLVKQEPGWQDGPTLLMQAFSSAGRSSDAIQWLEEAAPDDPDLYPTLADFYGRQGRWADAAKAYQAAIDADPRSMDLRLRFAASLLNAGTPDEAVKARDALREAVTLSGNDERALYLLSQAERETGDLTAAERTARRLIAVNRANPRGYVVLSEALEERQRYDAVVDALAPAVSDFRSGPNANTALGMLLPHLGFAYQALGQADKAVTTFEEARKLAPGDPAITSYLIQAQIAAKRFTAAADLAHQARLQHPDDLRLARLEAQALRQSGKVDQGIAILEEIVQKHGDDPQAYIALAQVYTDANKGSQAIKVLQNGQAKLPMEISLTFELGAIYDKQKRPADAEAAFRQVISKDPQHAPALNYLGYMLAERGEKLDESVTLVKRALEIEPGNGAYLDSLGWAYYKSGKLDLALENVGRAADQMRRNSVILDHYGDVLLKMGRYQDAIDAFGQALSGDLESIDKAEVDKKIRSARQKLPKR